MVGPDGDNCDPYVPVDLPRAALGLNDRLHVPVDVLHGLKVLDGVLRAVDDVPEASMLSMVS